MKSRIIEPKKKKVRAVQIQFKGDEEKTFFELRRIALDFDLDQTALCRLILTEWAWKYNTEKEKGGGPKAFQLPLFSETKTEDIFSKPKPKKAGKK